MDSGESSQTPKSHVRNPEGKNQHKDCPPKNDPRITQFLYEYQRREIFDKREISRLLLSEHGIKMSESSVARRRRSLGIYASGVTTRQLPDNVKRQLVLNQMAKDPTKKLGPRMIKQLIARETGIHLTRDYIRNEMLVQDPLGFTSRDTSLKRTQQESILQ
ncbi:hypothetical protein SERLA73DRAFT_175751 [Serpula lacrymans var. lacrymans S7.3]|uniref:Uncharacterized protein n=2 Tax=Serpula lacrymans var. lacrymans TaxID=341189 RepID=F8PLB1_SERL3|nr:uncharacterized protein SERLADRAFT_458336 [Serpula lacrymans var. lacrymans S7.9]EGO04019.1 hypothetical protein SERLA73DRAFT_175751 [Serpula lacrymans var. lacrymans S7.3]EGO29937.1 hypothetical protein SERLADRAFT_458336 [Serpula lacrymans var. lacrymans S7.9]